MNDNGNLQTINYNGKFWVYGGIKIPIYINNVPSLDGINTVYKDGSETENLNFHVFKIETDQGEANYFIHTDEQLNEFINNLIS